MFCGDLDGWDGGGWEGGLREGLGRGYQGQQEVDSHSLDPKRGLPSLKCLIYLPKQSSQLCFHPTHICSQGDQQISGPFLHLANLATSASL